MGQPPTTVLQRRQNSFGGPFGPGINLPLPSTDVGQRPQILDQWRQRYHPDQTSAAGLNNVLGDAGINPVHQLHDPDFYDYPMPALPAPTPDGHGGITIPPARQVR